MIFVWGTPTFVICMLLGWAIYEAREKAAARVETQRQIEAARDKEATRLLAEKRAGDNDPFTKWEREEARHRRHKQSGADRQE